MGDRVRAGTAVSRTGERLSRENYDLSIVGDKKQQQMSSFQKLSLCFRFVSFIFVRCESMSFTIIYVLTNPRLIILLFLHRSPVPTTMNTY